MKTILILILIAAGGFLAYKKYLLEPEPAATAEVQATSATAEVQATPVPSKLQFNPVEDLTKQNKNRSDTFEPTYDTSRSVPANRFPANRSSESTKNTGSY